MARIFKRSGKWWGDFRDELGVRVRTPLSTDRKAAMALLTDSLARVERRRAGIIDSTVEHAQRPLASHLHDFLGYLRVRQRTDQHIRLTGQRVESAIQGMKISNLGELSAERFADWLATARARATGESPSGTVRTYKEVALAFRVSLAAVNQWKRSGAPLTAGGPISLEAVAEWRSTRRRGQGLSDRSAHHYTACMKAFTNWLRRHGRLVTDPLASLPTGPVVNRSLVRRSLSGDELARFLDAADRSPKIIGGMPGPVRALIYTVACRTGLRRRELGSLRVGDIDLGENPSLRLMAKNAKNRKDCDQPLPASLVAPLGDFLRGRDPAELVFPGLLKTDTSEMVHRDLQAAGIPPCDEFGRIFDFHGLRTQFGSDLARSGVPLSTAVKLLRHSDAKLTLNFYTRLGLVDLADAVDRLPELTTRHKSRHNDRLDNAV